MDVYLSNFADIVIAFQHCSQKVLDPTLQEKVSSDLY